MYKKRTNNKKIWNNKFDIIFNNFNFIFCNQKFFLKNKYDFKKKYVPKFIFHNY